MACVVFFCMGVNGRKRKEKDKRRIEEETDNR
jgi:hypothetical protein